MDVDLGPAIHFVHGGMVGTERVIGERWAALETFLARNQLPTAHRSSYIPACSAPFRDTR